MCIFFHNKHVLPFLHISSRSLARSENKEKYFFCLMKSFDVSLVNRRFENVLNLNLHAFSAVTFITHPRPTRQKSVSARNLIREILAIPEGLRVRLFCVFQDKSSKIYYNSKRNEKNVSIRLRKSKENWIKGKRERDVSSRLCGTKKNLKN